MAEHEPNTLDFEVPVDGTDKSIGIARADQGSRIVQLAFANPGLGINLWEGDEGDDMDGFRARYHAWKHSSEEDLVYVDARFGSIAYLTREAIPLIVAYSLQYMPRENTRAPVARRALVDGSGLPILRRAG